MALSALISLHQGLEVCSSSSIKVAPVQVPAHAISETVELDAMDIIQQADHLYKLVSGDA